MPSTSPGGGEVGRTGHAYATIARPVESIPMPAASVSRRIGQLLSATVVVLLLIDGAVQLFQPALVAQEMIRSGWPMEMAPVVGGIALLCALLYAIPQTAVIGAILITGFVGGAIATHLRLNEIGSPDELICAAIGIAAWAGLWLRGRISREPETMQPNTRLSSRAPNRRPV